MFFCLLFPTIIQAQTPFRDRVFDQVKTLDSVYYATAKNFGGTDVNLHMDIYLPDTLDNRERPLIIFGHGGTFLSGSRKSPDLVIMCNELAQRGYICASIDYRKGINVLREFKDEFAKAAWRAMQDHRTAIRYFRRSYAKGNPYHIDTSQIFLGGVSAGAIASLHAGFQTDTSEIPENINVQSVGGLFDGDYDSYSSGMKGVINLFGALSERDYIDFPPEIMLCHVHGNSDRTVPYKSDVYSPNGIEIGVLHGSYIIDSVARSYGMNSTLKTLHNKGHVPYTRDSAYLDTTLNFIIDCMYDKVKLGKIVGVETLHTNEIDAEFWMNENGLNYRLNSDLQEVKIEIINLRGQTIGKFMLNGRSGVIQLPAKTQGAHFMRITSNNQQFYRKIMSF